MSSPDNDDQGFEALDLTKTNSLPFNSAETGLQELPDNDAVIDIKVEDAAPAVPTVEPSKDEDDALIPLEGEDADDAEKRKAFGRKAKKRFDDLTAKNYELQRELESAREAQKRLENEKREFYKQKAKDARSALNAHAESLKIKLKAAKEAGNIDEEVDIADRMADVKARLIKLAEWEQTNFEEEKKPNADAPATQRKSEEALEDKPQAQPQAAKEPSPRLKKWMQNNPWFDLDLYVEVQQQERELDTESPKELRSFQMTSTALAIHHKLIAQGYSPDDETDADKGQEAYLKKLNEQMRKAFPDAVKKPAAPSVPPIAPKAKPSQQGSARGAEVVTMTADEYAMARRLAGHAGIPVERIAAEKAKLLKADKKGQY